MNETPEEINRQKVIKYLIGKLRVPKDKIIVERGLASLGVKDSRKRIDIGILDIDGNLLAIIECKDSLPYSDTVYEQAQDYMTSLGVKIFFVADNNYLSGYYWNGMQFVLIEDSIPIYSKWTQMMT